MSRKANGVNFGKTEAQRSRRERVIVMLGKQLKSGVKTDKEGNTVPLTDKDIVRINKETETLKSRV